MGATDSAAPCAMLMWVAKVVDGYLQRMWDEMKKAGEGGTVEMDMDMGIQILLLDGEEAFRSWTDTDSLYGARYVSLSAFIFTYSTPFLLQAEPPGINRKTNTDQLPSRLMVTNP